MTKGDNVLAPADGTVRYVDNNASGAGGKELAINHSGPTGKNFTTVYLHLSKILVKEGDFVKQGQVVAESGNTGDRVDGEELSEHLHFHIYRPRGSYDSHTMPIERLVMKQVGVDTDFKEYNANRGELDDNKTEYKTFESNNIRIVPVPKITVTAPRTGDRWLRGTTQTIRWNYSGDLGNYATIELLEQGRVYQTLIYNVSQSNGVGSYYWAIPSNFNVSKYQIRVSAGGLSDITGNFRIVQDLRV